MQRLCNSVALIASVQLPVWLPNTEILSLQTADKSETGTLEGEEFVLFYKALTQRDDVLEIFEEYSEDGKKMTLLEFVDFLLQEQKESNSVDELAMELIDRYEPSESGGEPGEECW